MYYFLFFFIFPCIDTYFSFLDINECLDLTSCDVNADCTNINGSFSCSCKPGYTGDGKTCTDIIDCVENRDDPGYPCNKRNTQKCTDVAGGYACECLAGFQGKDTYIVYLDLLLLLFFN